MQIRVKKLHPKAKLPTRGTSGAGGLDLYAVKDMMLLEDTPTKVPTGIAIEIPTGHAGFIMTRSSTARSRRHRNSRRSNEIQTQRPWASEKARRA